MTQSSETPVPTILGEAGAGMLKGGADGDLLDGGKGADKLYGGKGFDEFVFTKGSEHDTIFDFDANGGQGHQDMIGIDPGTFASLTIKGLHGNTIITSENGDMLTIKDIAPSKIDASDFADYMGP